MSTSFTSKKRPEKALYVPPGARRSDKGTSEKCGDLVPTDDNVSSASSPTEAYVAKSGHSQGQPWKQPGVSGGGGLLGQGEISQNRAPKERKDRDRGRNQHGRLPPKHNFRGGNNSHSRLKPFTADDESEEMNGKTRRINQNHPNRNLSHSNFATSPPSNRYGAHYREPEAGFEVTDSEVPAISSTKSSERIDLKPESVADQQPSNESAVQLNANLCFSSHGARDSRNFNNKTKFQGNISISNCKSELKDNAQSSQFAQRPVTRRIGSKKLGDAEAEMQKLESSVMLNPTSKSFEFRNLKMESDIPSLDEAKQYFEQQTNVADVLNFRVETEDANNNNGNSGSHGKNYRYRNSDSLLVLDTSVAPSQDVANELTVNTDTFQVTHKVRRMKPQKLDMNPDTTADVVKFDMLRNNPRNRTLFDPNVPSLASKISALQEKSMDPNNPSFSPQMTVPTQFRTSQSAQYSVSRSSTDSDPTINLNENQKSALHLEAITGSIARSEAMIYQVGSSSQSSVNTSSKPTAQVLPTPSTNNNLNPANMPTHHQKAAFIQQLQQLGLNLPENFESQSEFAPMFLQFVQFFQAVKNYNGGQSLPIMNMFNHQQQFDLQQDSQNPQQRPSNEFADFEKFLNGNMPGNGTHPQPSQTMPNIRSITATMSSMKGQNNLYIPETTNESSSTNAPMSVDPMDTANSFHQFLTGAVYPNTSQIQTRELSSINTSNSCMPNVIPGTSSLSRNSKATGNTGEVKNSGSMPRSSQYSHQIAPLSLSGFPTAMQNTGAATESSSPSTLSGSYEKMSAGLQMKIGEMCRMGNIDVNQLVSLETNNPKASFIRDKMLKQITSLSVKESQVIEAQLEEKIKNGNLLTLKEDVSHIRNSFMRHCEHVIVYDSENAHNHNMEYVLWKNAFYVLIERLRKLLNDQTWKYHAEKLLQEFLDEGIEFYQEMLNKLQQVRSIDLNDYLTPEVQLRLVSIPKKVVYIISSAFKLHIGLGDLYRYKETVGSSSNFGNARHAYLKAQHLLPKNGRAFNQLAILAWHLKRRFETVYFYMRSLAAQEDFKGARESLNSMFEDVAKKVKAAHEKTEAKVNARIKEEQEKLMDMIKVRGKITWVKNNHELPPGDEFDMAERWRNVASTVQREMLLSLADSDTGRLSCWPFWKTKSKSKFKKEFDLPGKLNRQLVLSFLNIHGKLFTSIGMETFKQQFNQTSEEFKILLNHEPLSTPDERFLQLIIINIFAIYNTAKRGEDNQLLLDSKGKVPRSEANVAAINFGMMIAQNMVDKVMQILHTKRISLQDIRGDSGHSADQEVEGFLDFRTLIPAVKLWASWMMNNKDYWNPLPDCNGLLNAHNVWTSWCNLFNQVQKMNASQIPLSWEQNDDSIIVLLHETVSVAGFKPMNGFTDQPFFIPKNSNRLAAEHSYRFLFLLNFANFLASEVQCVYQNATTMEYEACLPEISTPVKINSAEECGDMKPSTHSRCTTESSDDGLLAELQSTLANYNMHSPKQFADTSAADGSGIYYTDLQLEKLRLESQHEAGLRMMETKEMMMNAQNQKMRVEPLYVVIDTNAFIDHLSLVDRIARAKKYQVVVPLTVANELVGLSKPKQSGDEVWSIRSHISGSVDSSSEDPQAAAEAELRVAKAETAVQYIKEKVSEKPSLIKLKTFKGVVVHELAFKTAPFDGSNDDAIIHTALHNIPSNELQQEKENPNRSEPIRRTVVLLTEDRNLMLKSINVHSLPATTITEFVRIYDL